MRDGVGHKRPRLDMTSVAEPQQRTDGFCESHQRALEYEAEVARRAMIQVLGSIRRRLVQAASPSRFVDRHPWYGIVGAFTAGLLASSRFMRPERFVSRPHHSSGNASRSTHPWVYASGKFALTTLMESLLKGACDSVAGRRAR